MYIINGKQVPDEEIIESGTKMFRVSIVDDESLDVRLIATDRRTGQLTHTKSGIRLHVKDVPELLDRIVEQTGLPVDLAYVGEIGQ